jgi:wobble nucleotide-excising tRNase
MLEHGFKVFVKGGPFNNNEVKDFDLLENKKSSLIYGVNGSGKSTISKAINEFRNEVFTDFELVYVKDSNNDIIDNMNKNNIYVYNESFIDDNIKFKEKGLNTIVLIGNDKKDDSKLEQLNLSLKELIKKKNELNIEEISNSKSDKSSLWWQNKIFTVLKKDNGWADRQKRIKEMKNKESVIEEKIVKIVNEKEKITVEQFNNKLKEYEAVRENNEMIDIKLEKIKYDNDYNEKLNELLIEVIKKERYDEISSIIYKTIEKHGDTRIHEIMNTFEDDIDYCPYCFQKISDSYRNSILDSINQLFSNEKNKLVNRLNNFIFDEYSSLVLPNIIDDGLKNRYFIAYENLNNKIKENNRIIDEKISNLYEKKLFTQIDFRDDLNDLNTIVDEINNAINIHNFNCDKTNQLRLELQKFNNYLAYEEIEKDYMAYIKKLEENNNILKEYKKSESEIEDLSNKIENLKATMGNVTDAISEINKNLALIFMNKERLRLEYKNDNYVVTSNGSNIKLKNLSTGERNIISLCYFFSMIGENNKLEERFKDEMLIVIDDPVSSFDNINKIGVFCFLRKMISNIYEENKDSRFILMTHSYDAAYNFHKLFIDIDKTILNTYELTDFSILKKNKEFRNGSNQYKRLISEIYNFADGNSTYSEAIGNYIRRVLEMYSSFEYAVGMDELGKLLKDCGNCEELNDYYENYLYRLLVNNESHSNMKAFNYEGASLFYEFTEEQKRTAAKSSLVLLKNLNELHIKKMLKGKDYNKITEWENEIISIVGV